MLEVKGIKISKPYCQFCCNLAERVVLAASNPLEPAICLACARKAVKLLEALEPSQVRVTEKEKE